MKNTNSASSGLKKLRNEREREEEMNSVVSDSKNKGFWFDARTRGGNCSKFTEYEDGVAAALGQSEGATCHRNEKRFSCCD